MAVSAKNIRTFGIDILRALAMFFVICQHILGQGGVLGNAAAGSGKFYFLSFLQILVYCAVDIYGITTGYLLSQKKFQLARLAKLWLTTVFWSAAVSCCFFIFVPESRTFSEIVSMFFPVLRGRYWFFTAYFVVMLASPVLNLVIRSLNKRQFHLLFAALFVIFGAVPIGALGNDVLRISTGHHFSWMIVLYLIGGYLRMHGADILTPIKRTTWLMGYFLLAGVHLAYKMAVNLIGLPGFGDLMLTYPSPLILGEAICLFLFCKDAFSGIAADGLIGKIVSFVTPGVYAVYVIHVHPKVFWSSEIIALFRRWDGWNGLQIFGAMLLTAFGVFTACILLDALRQRLFRILYIDEAAVKLSERIEGYIRERIK